MLFGQALSGLDLSVLYNATVNDMHVATSPDVCTTHHQFDDDGRDMLCLHYSNHYNSNTMDSAFSFARKSNETSSSTQGRQDFRRFLLISVYATATRCSGSSSLRGDHRSDVCISQRLSLLDLSLLQSEHERNRRGVARRQPPR